MRAPSFLYSGQTGKTSNYLGSHLREVLQIKFKKKKIRKGRGRREANGCISNTVRPSCSALGHGWQ
jgi:hypothetical protein